jgi:hypothetical protein
MIAHTRTPGMARVSATDIGGGGTGRPPGGCSGMLQCVRSGSGPAIRATTHLLSVTTKPWIQDARLRKLRSCRLSIGGRATSHPTAERTSCVDQEPGLRPAGGACSRCAGGRAAAMECFGAPRCPDGHLLKDLGRRSCSEFLIVGVSAYADELAVFLFDPATELGESVLGVSSQRSLAFQANAHGMSPSAARSRRRHLTRWRSPPRSAPAAQPLPSHLLSDVRSAGPGSR